MPAQPQGRGHPQLKLLEPRYAAAMLWHKAGLTGNVAGRGIYLQLVVDSANGIVQAVLLLVQASSGLIGLLALSCQLPLPCLSICSMILHLQTRQSVP